MSIGSAALSNRYWPRSKAGRRVGGTEPAGPSAGMRRETEEAPTPWPSGIDSSIVPTCVGRRLPCFSDWGRGSQAVLIEFSALRVLSLPQVTRFSSRSAPGRRMMGSGERGVSICFATLRACARRHCAPWRISPRLLSTRSPITATRSRPICARGRWRLRDSKLGYFWLDPKTGSRYVSSTLHGQGVNFFTDRFAIGHVGERKLRTCM
jgi:hypothetical protein